MGRMRRLSAEQRRELRRRLILEELGTNHVGLAETVQQLRRVTGLTQAEFARKIAAISPGALAQIERGEGNPRLDTLQKIGAAFGLRLGFVRQDDLNAAVTAFESHALDDGEHAFAGAVRDAVARAYGAERGAIFLSLDRVPDAVPTLIVNWSESMKVGSDVRARVVRAANAALPERFRHWRVVCV